MKPKEALALFDQLPTTRIRVLVTIGLIAATGVTYLFYACNIRHTLTQSCISWEPSVNWLMFLAALAGVDVTQYFVKGFTGVQQAKVSASVANTAIKSDQKTNQAIVNSLTPAPAPEENVTATSDISELNREDELKG